MACCSTTPIGGGSDPPVSAPVHPALCRHQTSTLAAAFRVWAGRRTPSGDEVALILNILLAAALPRHDSPFVTRSAGPCPSSAQPVKASRVPFAAKYRFLAEIPCFAPSALPASRSHAPGLCGNAAPIWDRLRRPTLVGLLRHSKWFFGPLGRSGDTANAIQAARPATARAMPERSWRTATIASPLSANKRSTSPCCPAPISTTRWPWPMTRRASAAIAR